MHFPAQLFSDLIQAKEQHSDQGEGAPLARVEHRCSEYTLHGLRTENKEQGVSSAAMPMRSYEGISIALAQYLSTYNGTTKGK